MKIKNYTQQGGSCWAGHSLAPSTRTRPCGDCQTWCSICPQWPGTWGHSNLDETYLGVLEGLLGGEGRL